jgi:class 3 adenylate cyclase
MRNVLTLLFTDVEGSRALERQSPVGAARALVVQDDLVRASVARHGGRVLEQTGDGLYASLPSPRAAALAAVDAQRAILAAPWPDVGPVRVRMALHAVTEGATVSPWATRRCGHLLSIGHGGQILLTGPTARLLRQGLPDGLGVWPLGRRQRHPLSRPEEVYQLLDADLPATFPPPTSLWPRRWRRWREQIATALRRVARTGQERGTPAVTAADR